MVYNLLTLYVMFKTLALNMHTWGPSYLYWFYIWQRHCSTK